jgi:hypothetical protein
VNPLRDPQLTGSQPVVPERRETHGARYVEIGLGLLQNARLFGRVPATVTLGGRHERVDPLYRSIGVSTQADRQQDAIDVTTSFGALSAQVNHTRSTDNLGHVASVLTSPTRATTASLAAPLAALFRVKTHQQRWPSITYSINRTHQFSTALPTNGDFRPIDLPDQMNIVHDASVQWLIGRWRASYRVNANTQDNRQPGRERSDFSALVHVVSLGASVGPHLDLGVDGNLEARHNKELDQTAFVHRIGTLLNWRPGRATTVGVNVSITTSEDEPRTSSTTNGEYRLELTRSITLRKPSGQSAGSSGQLVLRFARTETDFAQLAAPNVTPLPSRNRAQWTVSSGLSLRLF